MLIKMMKFFMLSLLLKFTTQQSCTIFDYTKQTVSCVQSCPLGSNLVDNKCLRKDQYLIQGSVQICPSSHTSDDRQLCCQIDEYIFDGQCQGCNGQVYENGLYCCSGSEYMNYAGKIIGCTKIGTGECINSITLISQFKVCCSSGQFYHVVFKTCVTASSFNCNSTLMVCCNVGDYLEYIQESGTYKCLQNCGWNRLNSLQCSKKFCNSYQMQLPSEFSVSDLYSSLQITNSSLTQMVYGNQCCYGLSTTNSCIKNMTALECGKRFVNRGWSVCCAFGLYYSVKQRACLDSCTDGFIVMDMVCVTNGNFLQLNGVSGTAPLESSSPNCNGLTLPISFPVCCPKNFYFDGFQGCKYCSGTIHKISMSQTCCLSTEYFDKTEQSCKFCVGKVDKTGTLCCFENQYFSYSQSGVGSCNSLCSTSNIYQTSYCCESLTISSCQNSGFKPNICNDEYFVQGSCQVCPRFCSNTNICTTGDTLQCSKSCKDNTAYFADLNECLACDNSCNGCTNPFDSTACTSCAWGYVMVNRVCVKCGINCRTCSGSMNNCTSCYQDSPQPYYENNRCSRLCDTGSYDDSTQCQSCNFNCVQCQGSTSMQCSKCSKGSFLAAAYAGECQICSGVCDECFKNSSSCITCKTDYKYYPNTKTCTTFCEMNEISLKFTTNSLEVCFPCHSACKSCQLSPENCNTCKSNTQYIDSSLGISLCMDCVSPCVLCISKQNCTTCINGYFLNRDTQKCIQCASTCKTCFNGTDTSCLSCFGDSQLMSGKCVGCSSSCAKCDINQNCLDCKDGFFLYSGSCSTICPDGFFGANKKCSLCYLTCKTCFNESEKGCQTCAQNLQLVSGKCVGCPGSCLNCGENLTCIQCNSGFYLYQQNCLTECPKGTYASDDTCKQCVSNCTACVSASSCTQCAIGVPIFFRSQCLIDCPTGYEKITNSNSCQLKNNTDGNNTNGNNTNSNNTNGNSTNGNSTDNNNTNGNNTDGNNTNGTNATNQTTTFLLFQTFNYDMSTTVGLVNLYFSNSNETQINSLVSKFKMYLINLKTLKSSQVPLNPFLYDYKSKKVTLQAGPFNSINTKDYDAILTYISKQTPLKVLQNSINVKSDPATDPSSIIYKKISSQSYNQLIVADYKSTPLNNIKTIGISISIILLLFSTLSKLKSHFLAQQSNALLLHFINFAQVVYLFKYIKLDQNGLYGSLQGFGYSMFSFFPNFFNNTIPQDYVEITFKGSLIPDANLIRNAGFVFSYQLIVLGLLIIGSLISYVWWKKEKLEVMPQIRKVMRMGVFWFHIGFLPQLFFSFAQLIVPTKIQPEYSSFHTTNVSFSYVLIFLIPILMGLIFYHFYATYNSDVLEHYYTLRQGGQYVQIYVQALILAMAIDRPLIALCLIPVQLLWLGFNYMLYRYGEGYHILDCTKFIVSSGLICLGLIFLCLVQYITWEVIIAFLVVSFAVNFAYGLYQVIGLYYYYLFKDKGSKNT